MKSSSAQFKKGQPPWNKGMKMSDEQKSKIDQSGLSLGRAWNKGKKSDLCGKKHWNWKGAVKYVCSDCDGKKSHRAKTCRECTKKYMSENMKGNTRKLGYKLSVETKRKMSEYRVKNPIQVYKDTKIEVTMEKMLQKYGIYYEKQISLCKVTVSDFYLERYKIAVFCDGCYWHGCRIHRSIDKSVQLNKKQNRILIENGIAVLRFWEHDINTNPELCIQRVINLINFKEKHYGR